MSRITIKSLINQISKEEIIEKYINENCSQHECAQFFNITDGLFIGLLKEYDIKKDHKLSAQLAKESKLERYGDPNYNNREQSKITCIEKYGVDNPFKDKEKIKQSYIDKYGVDHPMKVDSIKEKVISKIDYSVTIPKGRQTYFEKTGYDNPGKDPRCQRKGIETKIKHGVYDSPHNSNEEQRLFKILKRKYSEVIRSYRDIRYSRSSGYQFECDFYIPSEDLFIELNAHPSHGLHPYDKNNDNDRILAEKLSISTKPWESATYDTWCGRDPEKLEIARNNSLNYITLYPSSSIHDNIEFNDKRYSDLIKWLLKKLIKG